MTSAALADYAVTGEPCGSARMAINGEIVMLRASGALWLEDVRTLIVADLHFEKGSAFASRGQMLPPFDTRETLRRLQLELMATEARVVVFLGDTLHDRKAGERIDDADRGHIEMLSASRTLIWICGNHDADGPQGLPGETVEEMSIGGLRLRHEPRGGLAAGEVAGHLHPCARVVGKGGSVRRRCFVTDGERVILPAFGAYAGGLNIRDVAFSGLFARAPLAVALGQTRAHPVVWGRVVGD